MERNHYSVDWINNNEKKGIVRNITPPDISVKLTRTLSCLNGYPAVKRTVSYLPVKSISRFEQEIQTGDLIWFGTTQENLDVKHTGILISKNGLLTLRHASRSAGKVMDESLTVFLGRFGESPGVILARPV